MKVLFLPEVQEYYDNLEQILYEKGYFAIFCYGAPTLRKGHRCGGDLEL